MLTSKSRTLPNNKPSSRAGWLVAVALWTLFIWSKSLFAGPESSAQSNFVVILARPFFEALGLHDVDTMGFIVRKTAHFTEYTILGILLGLSCPERGISWREELYGAAVPSVDETIQLFVPGRSGQITDVMLDCAGVAFGMTLVSLVKLVRNKRKE